MNPSIPDGAGIKETVRFIEVLFETLEKFGTKRYVRRKFLSFEGFNYYDKRKNYDDGKMQDVDNSDDDSDNWFCCDDDDVDDKGDDNIIDSFDNDGNTRA